MNEEHILIDCFLRAGLYDNPAEREIVTKCYNAAFEAKWKLSGINQSNGEEQSTQGKGRREKLFCPFCGGTNITDTHKSMYACQNCSKGWEK